MFNVKRYKTGKILGQGGFGTIYNATDLITGEPVAIKFEHVTNKTQLLPYEARVYDHLQNQKHKGIPRMHYFGVEAGYNIMVLDLLGDSLNQKLLTSQHNRFTLPCVLLLADKILSVIARVHDGGFVHRDIKPSNFMLSPVPGQHTVFIIDFGLSKCYWDYAKKQHIPRRDGKRWLGTARYSSVAAHCGVESCRKDDLQSIGFMLLLFIQGSLPWDYACQKKTKKENAAKTRPTVAEKLKCLQTVCDIKQQSLQNRTLCAEVHPVFQKYFDAVDALAFSETPNYVNLRQLFRDTINDMNIPFQFDWAANA